MAQYELGTFDGKAKRVKINNEVYQIQEVEFEDEIFFFIQKSGEVVCMIMQDEKAEWMPDCNVSEELFEQIMKCINKLFIERILY